MKTIAHNRFRIFSLLPVLIFLVLNSFEISAQGWRATTSEDPRMCEINTAVAQTPDNGFLVASHYLDSASNVGSIRLHKMDQDGAILWTKDIVDNSQEITIKDLIASSDGNFVLTARHDSSTVTLKHIYVLKINAQADIIWEHDFSSNGLNGIFLEKGIETLNGDYVFVGDFRASFNDRNLIVHRLDSNGVTLWTKVKSNAGGGLDLIDNPDNSVIAVGYSGSSVIYPAITKYSPSGNIVWDTVYQHLGYFIQAIEKADNGYFLLLNEEQSNVPSLLKKVDLNGNEIWTKSNLVGDYFLDMKRSQDGGLFLHGHNGSEALAAKLDSLGNIEWRREIRDNKEFQRGLITNNGDYVCSGIGTEELDVETFYGTNFSVDFVYGCGIRDYATVCPYPTFASVYVVPNIPNSSPPYVYQWVNGSTVPSINFCPNSTFTVTITDNNGDNFVAQGTTPSSLNHVVELVKIDGSGNLYSNVVTGNVFEDTNDDCAFANGEPGLQSWMVVVDGDESFVTLTDSAGNFNFGIDSGAYTITTPIPNPLFENCLPVTAFTVNEFDSLNYEWPVKTIECTNMELDVHSNLIRRCTTTAFYFEYRNQGTIDATNSYVEVTFDTTLTIVSSSIPWSNQTGNTFTFQLGTVPYNTPSKTFSVIADVSCYTTQGQSICLNAHIYPDSVCIPPTAWDGSITELESSCGVDSLTFTIKNTGQNTMSNSLDYFIVEDNVILKNGTFFLAPAASKLVKVPSNGSTYRIYAEQAPGLFPPGYKPTLAVEGCGMNSSGTFSTGFVNNFPSSGNTNFSLDFCGEITGPYDPNDKSAVPEGQGVEHYIEQNIDLNYLIRFQNVGTDTAFNIVIRDTLSDHLDITSLQQGAASHNYRLEIVGNNILKFIFPDIKLVDSIANEPESHGFVSFKIGQDPNLPIGTMIYNSAAIYFDYEAPVITNETYHEVGENFIQIVPTEDLDDQAVPSQVKVFPNPFNESAELVLEHSTTAPKTLRVCDAMGRVVLAEIIENNRYRIYRNQLPAGLYFFTISDQQQLIETGKLVIK